MDEDSYCGICKYFVRQAPGADAGYCKRYPPTLVVLGLQQPALQGQAPIPVTTSCWPPIGDIKNCGEFRAADRPKVIDPRSIDLSKLEVEEAEGKA